MNYFEIEDNRFVNLDNVRIVVIRDSEEANKKIVTFNFSETEDYYHENIDMETIERLKKELLK